MKPGTHRVVIVGGGFGGLRAVRGLARAPVDITLVDRRNFHLFQPLLYQVATGGLSPGDIASPLRGLLRRQRNAQVLLAEAVDLDVAARRLILGDGAVDYDTLVLAAGSRDHYFGNPEWQALAPGLKTVEDATEIRRRILLAFEAAEREPDPARRSAWLTFVIAGGGPTGAELAGTLGEIAHHTLRQDFRHIDPRQARILLVEAVDRVLPGYPASLSAKAAVSLQRLGVEVRAATRLTAIAPDNVTLRTATGSETIPARTVLWAAGIRAAPLGQVLATRAGAELDRGGRVRVAPDLTVPGHPEIFVIGDMAAATNAAGEFLPGVAPVAIQQGRYVARAVARRLRGAPPPAPFRYVDHGRMATIGRGAAVAEIGRLRFAGYPAWLVWLFVHLLQLVEYRNRVLVLIQWAWNYFTWGRGARLITGGGAPPGGEPSTTGAPPGSVASEAPSVGGPTAPPSS